MARDPDLDEALRLIDELIDGETCHYGWLRRDGESCAEALTRQQGVPRVGCDLCRGREFMKRLGYKRARE